MKIRESDKWAYYQLFSDIDLEGKKLLDIGGGGQSNCGILLFQ